VNTPLLPQCPAYAGEHLGKGSRGCASPAGGPERGGGARALAIEQHNGGVECQQARGPSADWVLAIAWGGFPRQVFAAYLECRVEGPTGHVTLAKPLRLHHESCREARLIARRPGTIMDVEPPPDGNQVLPLRYQEPVPVTRSRALVVPPDHATVSLVRVTVCTMPSGGAAAHTTPHHHTTCCPP
jgi:hypothetical protein